MARILCAEDDEDIRLILEYSLATVGGHTVRLCSDAQEVVSAAPSFAPDLILLDVMMPGGGGPWALHELRLLKEVAHVPMVFLTAQAMADDLEDLLQHGATGVIVKPFDPMSLPKQLVIYLEYGRAKRTG